MYLVYPFWNRPTFTPVWSVSLQRALELIAESVQGEQNDERFYDQLMELAPDSYSSSVVESIRDDERGHKRMFKQIYKNLTGYSVTEESLKADRDEEAAEAFSFREGLLKAFQGELAAVEKYRSIWFGLPYGIYKDTLYGIILDEQKHAAKYNHLLITCPA